MHNANLLRQSVSVQKPSREQPEELASTECALSGTGKQLLSMSIVKAHSRTTLQLQSKYFLNETKDVSPSLSDRFGCVLMKWQWGVKGQKNHRPIPIRNTMLTIPSLKFAKLKLAL